MTLDLFGPPERAAPRLAHIYPFAESAEVYCFDQYDILMPEFCGAWAELRDRIMAAATRDTIIHGGHG